MNRLVLLLACLTVGCVGRVVHSAGEEVTMVIEYRQISLGVSCLSNWRVRIDDNGAVFYSRNERDCPREEQWTADYPTEAVVQLTEKEQRALMEWILASGLLELDKHIENPNRVTTGGVREEVEITINGKRHDVGAPLSYVPVIETLRKRMLTIVRR